MAATSRYQFHDVILIIRHIGAFTINTGLTNDLLSVSLRDWPRAELFRKNFFSRILQKTDSRAFHTVHMVHIECRPTNMKFSSPLESWLRCYPHPSDYELFYNDQSARHIIFCLQPWPGTYIRHTNDMNRALIWDFDANETERIPSYVAHVDTLVGEIFAGRNFRGEKFSRGI